MSTIAPGSDYDPKVAERLFAADLDQTRRFADRLFAALMALQLVGVIAAALVISPRTWIGAESAPHVHVYATLILGPALAALPLVLVWTRPGAAVTRYVVAAAQILFSSLLIHVTGGRIETHFHVFGSLAFLAFYRDFRVLTIATLATAADHLVRGLYWPQSVFGILDASAYRWLEHAGWVLFEVVFLALSVRQSRQQMHLAAVRSAELEAARGRTQNLLQARSRELDSYTSAIDAGSVLMITNRDHAIEHVNENFCRLSGYSREELLGANPRVVNSGHHPAAFFAEMHARIEAGTLWRGVIRNRARDGSFFWLDMTIVPALTEAGKPDHFVAVSVDVTHLKRVEHELEAARDTAERASTVKSEFLANMSHEIRTPMTAILGYADLLLSGGNEPEARRSECATTIKRNGEHLLTIINDILDISKIEAGRMEVEQIETDPTRILQQVLDLLSVKASEKGLDLVATYETAIPTVIRSDPTRLRQILMNLTGNAIKFTRAGRVLIRVTCRPGRQQLEFDVVDSGIGIAPERVARLFEAFSQADTSTTRKFGGTGLGLRISQRLAEMLGGGISVESEPGRGSAFTLTVATGPIDPNRMQHPSGNVDASARPTEVRAPATRPLDGVRILLAEDGLDNQKLIALHLRKAGAEVTIVDNGRLAVQAMTVDGTRDGDLADPPPFDLLVSDMQMPEMDGYTATALLRRKGATLPIVALTAHAMSDDEERCREAGCSGYATKPIRKKELLETCQAALATTGTIGTASGV